MQTGFMTTGVVDVTLPRLQGLIERLRFSELEVSRHPLPFVAGAVTGVLLIGLVWIVASYDPPSVPNSPAGSVGARAVEALPSVESTQAQPESDRLQSCREVFAGQTKVLRTVPDPLSQWQVHIGAMNKLVTGVISLKQATQFWNQTRVGAAQGLARYQSASHAFAQRTVRCPRTGDETLTTDARQCIEAVAARARELATAGTALATWRVHVHHMEMLRTGEMTPAQATQLWLRSWHAGVQELAVYRAAARQASGGSC
jgi:hypothetical protein